MQQLVRGRNPGAQRSTLRVITAIAFATAMLGHGTRAHAQEVQVEGPPTLVAADLLPAAMVRGPHHTVIPAVRNDGYMNHYEIRSDYGRFYVAGNALLRERVHEINAIAKLRQVKTTEAYIEGLKRAAASPFVAARNVLMDPVGTVEHLGAGVRSVFRGVSERVRGGGRGETEDRPGKELLGFSKMKRQYAYTFGVDPYSTNVVLQQELNDLAWASFAGGLPMRIAYAAVPGAAGAQGVGVGISALQLTDSARQRLRDEPPPSLQAHNRERLRAARVSDREISALFNNPKFSPRHETELADALIGMQRVRNRRALVVRATQARSEEEVVFFVRNIQLYSLYHRRVAPLRRIVEWNGFVIGLTADGRLVAPVAIDYLAWTQRNEGIFSALAADARTKFRAKAVDIWVAGRASPLARHELQERGITLREQAFDDWEK